METILITGGTGMIGTALTKKLVSRGDQVIILTRGHERQKETPGVRYAAWDVEKQTIDTEAVAKADHIVHLAGANVAQGRWTEKRRKEILDSRVKSSELIVRTLNEVPNKVRNVISASATGYYGPDPSIPNPKPFTENNPPYDDFLGNVVVQWEGSIAKAAGNGRKVSMLRTGIVLSREGGAYAEFRKPLKFGLATVLGKGNQIVSWIHIDDLLNMYCTMIDTGRFEGPFNAVAPNPVSNETLIKAIAAEVKPSAIKTHVPGFALKLALGEMSVEILKSSTVSSAKIQAAGFRFHHETIESAVKAIEKSAF